MSEGGSDPYLADAEMLAGAFGGRAAAPEPRGEAPARADHGLPPSALDLEMLGYCAALPWAGVEMLRASGVHPATVARLPAEVTLIDDLLDRLGLVRERGSSRRAINAAGLDIIKHFEGCKLKAYRCPAGVLTIGYGSTGPHVRDGMTITQDQAEALLRSDLRRFEDYVATNCAPATDNQFSALVSLCFNVGERNLQSSTLRQLHLQGSYEAAADQFARWNKAGGKVLPGLSRRRAAEAQLYRSAT